MQDLITQERFELEVLDRLNSGKFLISPIAAFSQRFGSIFTFMRPLVTIIANSHMEIEAIAR